MEAAPGVLQSQDYDQESAAARLLSVLWGLQRPLYSGFLLGHLDPGQR